MNIKELQDLIDLAEMLGAEEVLLVKPGRDGSPPEYKDFTITGIKKGQPGQKESPVVGFLEKF